MLEIGGSHPIPAVLGIQPSILPDVENTSLSVRDDVLGDEHVQTEVVCDYVKSRLSAWWKQLHRAASL